MCRFASSLQNVVSMRMRSQLAMKLTGTPYYLFGHPPHHVDVVVYQKEAILLRHPARYLAHLERKLLQSAHLPTACLLITTARLRMIFCERVIIDLCSFKFVVCSIPVRRGPLSASSLDMVREEQARSPSVPIDRNTAQPAKARGTTQNAFFWCKRDICIRGPDRIPPSERTKWRRPISVSACTDTAEFGHMVICR